MAWPGTKRSCCRHSVINLSSPALSLSILAEAPAAAFRELAQKTLHFFQERKYFRNRDGCQKFNWWYRNFGLRARLSTVALEEIGIWWCFPVISTCTSSAASPQGNSILVLGECCSGTASTPTYFELKMWKKKDLCETRVCQGRTRRFPPPGTLCSCGVNTRTQGGAGETGFGDNSPKCWQSIQPLCLGATTGDGVCVPTPPGQIFIEFPLLLIEPRYIFNYPDTLWGVPQGRKGWHMQHVKKYFIFIFFFPFGCWSMCVLTRTKQQMGIDH